MRGLTLALEHERMHQETLAYMQAQQRRLSFEASLARPQKQLQMAASPQHQLHQMGMRPMAMGPMGTQQMGHPAMGMQPMVAAR